MNIKTLRIRVPIRIMYNEESALIPYSKKSDFAFFFVSFNFHKTFASIILRLYDIIRYLDAAKLKLFYSFCKCVFLKYSRLNVSRIIAVCRLSPQELRSKSVS